MSADPAEQLLATFTEDSAEARTIRHLIGYRTEYDALRRELATPPAGWFPFGHHVTKPDVGTLEFWGNEAGLPIWERPPAQECDLDELESMVTGAYDLRHVPASAVLDAVRELRAHRAGTPWHAAKPGEEWDVEYDPDRTRDTGFRNQDGRHTVYEANGGQLFFRRLEDDGAVGHLRVDNPLIRSARRVS